MNNMQYRPSQQLQTADQKQMGMWLHLSQLGNFIAPPAGIVAPIIIWQIKKDQMPALDAHGKMIVNWMISSLIYGVVSAILVFFLIGFFMLAALAIVGIVFPIIGAIKANNGEYWEYPLTIQFLK